MKTAEQMKLYWWADSRLGSKKRKELERYCRKAYKELKAMGCFKAQIPDENEREYVQRFFENLGYKVDNSSITKKLFINF